MGTGSLCLPSCGDAPEHTEESTFRENAKRLQGRNHRNPQDINGKGPGDPCVNPTGIFTKCGSRDNASDEQSSNDEGNGRKCDRDDGVSGYRMGFGKDNHGPMTELNTNTSEYLAEAIHIMVCNQYKNKYIKLLEKIQTIKRNITYKIEKVMPRLMPNENAIIYGKETQSNGLRQKRAIPLGLIFSSVSAIGGLIMKAVNTWTNYKKSKAMTKAIEKLYEAQEIDHRRLTRLEGQTSLLAKTTKPAFQHIDYRLLHLDTKVNYTVQHMTE